MPFNFHKTEIEGLLIIEPHIFLDHRGKYVKSYEKSIYHDNGIKCEFNECSDIYSKKGTIRGLHYQLKNSQAKLIRVISGTLFDVALDLREESKTFGMYHVELLDDKNNNGLFIPEGFAHGFMSLSDSTIFSYQCSGNYLPEHCGGIRWDDEDLKIPWPILQYDVKEYILSEKDRNLPSFLEYKKAHI